MLKKSPYSTWWTFLCFVLVVVAGILCFVSVWALDQHYQMVYGNLFGSFLIGLIGALCYCWGIKYGFIQHDSDTGPSYMQTPMDMLLFCSLGGLVALVFQSPQAETLTPIQAFVLGATWPSVVNRVISGNSQITKPNPINPPSAPSGGQAGQASGQAIPGANQPVPPSANIEPVQRPASSDA
jgi:hypothetical protein